MEKNSYDLEYKITGSHWWFVVRRKLLNSILSSLAIPPECPTLDVGCGIGSNLPAFESGRLKVIGLDHSFYALSLALKRYKIPFVNGDLNHLPFKANSFGMIVATDVIEHLEDDLNGLQELYRILLKGGILILTVPAFRFLWGIQDIVTLHKRRYSQKEILHKVKSVGFDVLRSSYFNFFLFFPILLARYFIRAFKLHLESENKINSPLLNSIVKTVFSLEPYILKYVPFPFGVSIFCIARK